MSPKQMGGAWYSFWSQGNDYTNYQTESGISSGVVRYLLYLFVFIIIIILILTIVHFLITPIFKTRPGQSGIISLPGSDDSKKFWQDPNNIRELSEKVDVMGLPEFNYSAMIDITIDNPLLNPHNNRPRVLLARSTSNADYSTAYGSNSTPQNLFNNLNQNLIVYLSPLTNDLNILIISAANELKTIELFNVPIRTGFTLTIVVTSSFFEAYINGKLVKTEILKGPPKKLDTNNAKIISPDAEIINQVARVGNLRLWGRPLSPAEIRSYSSPPIFPIIPINISGPASCPPSNT
jgi:hypothetical protein